MTVPGSVGFIIDMEILFNETFIPVDFLLLGMFVLMQH